MDEWKRDAPGCIASRPRFIPPGCARVALRPPFTDAGCTHVASCPHGASTFHSSGCATGGCGGRSPPSSTFHSSFKLDSAGTLETVSGSRAPLPAIVDSCDALATRARRRPRAPLPAIVDSCGALATRVRPKKYDCAPRGYSVKLQFRKSTYIRVVTRLRKQKGSTVGASAFHSSGLRLRRVASTIVLKDSVQDIT